MNNKRIDEIQKLLNSPDIIPKKAYRRDYFTYELICYVNNITACYLSGNFKIIPIFSQRCKIFFEEKGGLVPSEYRALVEEYIDLLNDINST